jgi:2-keto-3-deoxy-L-rhamnonate aldolase RhmA
LVLPQVKTREEARHIVRSTKYAPVGQRGVSISNTVTRFRDYDIETYTQWANRDLMTIVMIESEEGVDNVDSIVSTPGVDAVMMGPSDLSQDMGISGQIHHRKMERAFDKVVEYCNKYDVAPGIHVNEIEDVSKSINRGMRFITYNYDINLFKEASQGALQALHSLAAYK